MLLCARTNLQNLRTSTVMLALSLTRGVFFEGDAPPMGMASIAFFSAACNLILGLPCLRWNDTNPRLWYVKPRSLLWWERYKAWCAQDDPRFRSYFRLPSTLFDQPSDLLHASLEQGDIPHPLQQVRGREFPVERKVAIALMRLATGCSMRVVAEQFGCGHSTVVKIVDAFVGGLLLHMDNIIRWPSTPLEMQSMKIGMQKAQGTTSRWRPLKESFPQTGMIAMNSSFFRLAQANQILNGASFTRRGYNIREYIIGDGGYCELPWLLIPFQEPLSPSQARYNFRLSSTRMVVERAFGRLKSTWRILHGTIRKPDISRLPRVIAACCILHNMAIDYGLANTDDTDEALNMYNLADRHEYVPFNAINMESVPMYLEEVHRA
ncbi:hypothetical protein GOP47_0006919 [Adiantum capillus-veneris]|uniref:DDE Tnp4 domain-containing protein n=1 Tax=Adiantum capillus-veneris TaxID=13818 RepID=A0A9D4ZLE3_ADICA|nr:hypothetical protein GOP47_0006919 [Adiantum capillus-veneris]